ncbi:MAG: TatD family hydrolase [Treponema sp.]|nr:TatD family hydrolase [Treponema sp.]
MLIDFHTHLDAYTDKTALYEQLRNFDGTIIAASMDIDSYKQNLRIAEIISAEGGAKIIPTFGIHPACSQNWADKLPELDPFLEQSALIGEIGLDYEWAKDSPQDKQIKVFRHILGHCNINKKVCVIHTKGAEQDVLDILSDYPDAKIVIHWYDGPEEIFKKFMERGYRASFGVQTVRSPFLQKLLKMTPKDRLLAETDNPESEIWLGGTRSDVGLIKKVYADMAQILECPLQELEAQIQSNAESLLF